MQITEIETLPVSVGSGYDYAVIIVLVRTDDGLTGIGEASLAGRGRGVLGVIDHFAELLVGKDPARIEHWWSEMVRGTFWSTGQVIMSAVAGIDIALWDLKGKRLGVPVYDLLGGPTRERVRVYRHLAGGSATELTEDALRWREQGFTALRFGPLAAFDDHSLAGIRRSRSCGRSRRRRRCATHSATTSICSSTRTRCSPRQRPPTSVTRSSRAASTSTRTRSGPSIRCRCAPCGTR
jgi:L-alanine-DL-glutamate epimerase-like enolase superfamily enzyme